MKKLLNLNILPKEYQNLFTDDVSGLPNGFRSPWFDIQQKKRDRRDFFCNVVGSAYGAADSVFDPNNMEEIKQQLREPKYVGEITYYFDEDGVVVSDFNTLSGNRNLRVFVELIDEKLNQFHNYIIGIDISWGRGSSNSVAEIYDVNTKEQVAELVDPNIGPEDFADLMIALAGWVGGVDIPFLIWESNGGQGESFCDKIVWHGYTNIYTQKREDSKTRKETNKYGWRSFTDAKEWLLSELNIALSQGLRGNLEYNSIKIYSKELYDELVDYIFSERGSSIVTSSTSDLSTGARKRHGDRVIAIALCILGCMEQPKGETENIKKPKFGSFEYYRREVEEEKVRDTKGKKKYLF